MPVHLYGAMCDMRKIRKIADKRGLIVIEDAAHALEAERDGVRPGELGDSACFSFYATKNITCGEGGAVSTDKMEVKEKLQKMRLHGMDRSASERYSRGYRHWDMEALGWKYNMDDIHSALLLNQLRNIEKYWRRREAICRMYEGAFSKITNIRLLKAPVNSKNARHLFTILTSPEKRDKILLRLRGRGIGSAVNYRAVHLLKYYRKTFGYKRGMFPVAENIGECTVTIPLYPRLTDKEVRYIIQAVEEIS